MIYGSKTAELLSGLTTTTFKFRELGTCIRCPVTVIAVRCGSYFASSSKMADAKSFASNQAQCNDPFSGIDTSSSSTPTGNVDGYCTENEMDLAFLQPVFVLQFRFAFE